MTTGTLKEIERMNKAGLNDTRISEETGYSNSTIGYWRKKLGLPRVGINRAKHFTVYDGKTTQFVVEGTARECCARLHMTVNAFHSAVHYFRKGTYKRYEIYEVEE